MAGGCAGSSETVERPSTLPESMTPLRNDLTLNNLSFLNSSRDDFGSTMSLDTTLIFFTSANSRALGAHSIFWSRRTNAGWSTPELAVEINNSQSNGVPSILPGGQTMFFTGCDYGFGDCDLYRVESGVRGSVDQKTIPWTIPRNLGLRINSSYWDSQPCISADGSLMVFASDRPGGFGGRDIWITLRDQDGSWRPPINAGRYVNTVFDEMTPWIAPDNRTLYFASNGFPSIGGFDLYFVPIDPEVGYAPTALARNLGKPINSPSDDIALSISSDGSHTFLSSNRSGGKGGYDIYQLNLPPLTVDPVAIVRGQVKDQEGRPIFARVDVSDLRTGNIISRTQTVPETGEYAVVLRRDGNYGITAEGTGYLFNSRQIVVPAKLPENREYQLVHTLGGMDGWVRLLIFFASGGSALERESTVDLDRVVLFLQLNPDIQIEIGGHTDNTGTAENNLQLSQERADAVKAYLVGNRIPAKQITTKGYGQTKPIATNDTEKGREMNRRVELRVGGIQK
ncbi:MAG: OmpA family protein [Ignavibacteriae bacterium]|nr:OmpA family protein [Ignavibacteriota bacterium]MCB9214451.1 OmpA family protein [Ignavibacteria bacterium]